MNAVLQCLLSIDIFSNDLVKNYLILKEKMSKNAKRESLKINFKASLYR